MVDPTQSPREPARLYLVDPEPIRQSRGRFIGLGIAFMVLGVLAIFLPFAASLVTTIAIGWLLLIAGLMQGYHALQNRRWGASGWSLVGAAVEIIAGVLIVAFPLAGKLTLTLILAAYFIAEGVLKIVRAVQHRTLPAWGWLLFDGLVCLALGLLIWAHWPSTAVWAIGLLVGINLLFGGSSMLLLGLSARPALRARA